MEWIQNKANNCNIDAAISSKNNEIYFQWDHYVRNCPNKKVFSNVGVNICESNEEFGLYNKSDRSV